MVDGTPLLDIKPYVPDFDGPTPARTGWVGESRRLAAQTKSDKRFA
jgi:tRNA (Thr-GGU) A37 N-methylase